MGLKWPRHGKYLHYKTHFSSRSHIIHLSKHYSVVIRPESSVFYFFLRNHSILNFHKNPDTNLMLAPMTKIAKRKELERSALATDVERFHVEDIFMSSYIGCDMRRNQLFSLGGHRYFVFAQRGHYGHARAIPEVFSLYCVRAHLNIIK